MSTPVWQAAFEGFQLVFSWPNIIYPVAGTLLAMVFSFMPGLSGVTLMALAIPFTLSWEPLPIMLIFGAFVGGATFMGSVTAILFNIPGRPSSAAALLDGHPLAQQGEAKTALGCSAAASALGSTFGILVLILLVPVMRAVLLHFGPAEFFMLAVWGLTTIAAVSRGSLFKGLVTAGMGLMLSFVGYDPRTAELRYTFDSNYLRDGISLVPAFLGIFALAEVIELGASRRASITDLSPSRNLGGSAWRGARSVFTHGGLFLRSSVIGTVIGMIPGVGASVASFVAYGHAVQSEGKDGRFGRGDIRGVLAPEAANDAKDGGALIPTLAFGIPGGTGTAMLLAALTLHGITPGPTMMTTHLTLVFVLIGSLFFSNLLTSALGLAVVSPLARLTTVPTQRIVPIILGIAVTGAFVYRQRWEDVGLACLFGLLGYGMKYFGWPRVPLVIGLVLGGLFESNLHLAQQLHAHGRINFWTRPIAMTLLVLTVVGLLLPYVREKRRPSPGRATP